MTWHLKQLEDGSWQYEPDEGQDPNGALYDFRIGGNKRLDGTEIRNDDSDSSSNSWSNLKCHSCDSKITPENPCPWFGTPIRLPSYCIPCFDRIIKEKRWKGVRYYYETGEECPK